MTAREALENGLSQNSFTLRSLTGEAPSDDDRSLCDPDFKKPSAGLRRIHVYIFHDTPLGCILFMCGRRDGHGHDGRLAGHRVHAWPTWYQRSASARV